MNIENLLIFLDLHLDIVKIYSGVTWNIGILKPVVNHKIKLEPCAGKPHARFDEEGQELFQFLPLLYWRLVAKYFFKIDFKPYRIVPTTTSNSDDSPNRNFSLKETATNAARDDEYSELQISMTTPMLSM